MCICLSVCVFARSRYNKQECWSHLRQPEGKLAVTCSRWNTFIVWTCACNCVYAWGKNNTGMKIWAMKKIKNKIKDIWFILEIKKYKGLGGGGGGWTLEHKLCFWFSFFIEHTALWSVPKHNLIIHWAQWHVISPMFLSIFMSYMVWLWTRAAQRHEHVQTHTASHLSLCNCLSLTLHCQRSGCPWFLLVPVFTLSGYIDCTWVFVSVYGVDRDWHKNRYGCWAVSHRAKQSQPINTDKLQIDSHPTPTPTPFFSHFLCCIRRLLITF